MLCRSHFDVFTSSGIEVALESAFDPVTGFLYPVLQRLWWWTRFIVSSGHIFTTFPVWLLWKLRLHDILRVSSVVVCSVQCGRTTLMRGRAGHASHTRVCVSWGMDVFWRFSWVDVIPPQCCLSWMSVDLSPLSPPPHVSDESQRSWDRSSSLTNQSTTCVILAQIYVTCHHAIYLSNRFVNHTERFCSWVNDSLIHWSVRASPQLTIHFIHRVSY